MLIASSRLRMAAGDPFACAVGEFYGEGPVRTTSCHIGFVRWRHQEGRPADNRQATKVACSRLAKKECGFRCSVHLAAAVAAAIVSSFQLLGHERGSSGGWPSL